MGADIDTIYIVDDDPTVREALSSLLRASGKNVRLFTSGAEFLMSSGMTRQLALFYDRERRSNSAGEVSSHAV